MFVTAGNQMVLVQSEVNHRTDQNREPSRLLSLDYSKIGSGSSRSSRRLSADPSTYAKANRWMGVLNKLPEDSYRTPMALDWNAYSTYFLSKDSMIAASSGKSGFADRMAQSEVKEIWRSIKEYVESGKVQEEDLKTICTDAATGEATRIPKKVVKDWYDQRDDSLSDVSFGFLFLYADPGAYVEKESMQNWDGKVWEQMKKGITRADKTKMFMEDFVIWYIKDNKWDTELDLK